MRLFIFCLVLTFLALPDIAYTKDPVDKSQELLTELYVGIDDRDCGPYPSNYQDLVIKKIGRSLKDPTSAIFQFDYPPKKAITFSEYPATKEKAVFCYGGVVHVNAKNSYGGYNGFKYWTYFIRDGRVIESLGPLF